MNDHQPDIPPQPVEPPATHAPAPAAGKQRRTNAVIIGSAAAVIAAVVATGIIVVQNTGDDSGPATAATSTAPSAVDEAAGSYEENTPDPTYSTPTPDDFTISLRTTDRQCFGSAGCNVTVEPKLSYIGFTEDLDPNAVYEITYEIRGDQSGPVIATAELSNQTTLNFTPTLISTPSSSTKITVKITDVVTQGA